MVALKPTYPRLADKYDVLNITRSLIATLVKIYVFPQFHDFLIDVFGIFMVSISRFVCMGF